MFLSLLFIFSFSFYFLLLLLFFFFVYLFFCSCLNLTVNTINERDFRSTIWILFQTWYFFSKLFHILLICFSCFSLNCSVIKMGLEAMQFLNVYPSIIFTLMAMKTPRFTSLIIALVLSNCHLLLCHPFCIYSNCPISFSLTQHCVIINIFKGNLNISYHMCDYNMSGFVSIFINIAVSYLHLSMLSFESVMQLNTMGWYPLANLNNLPLNYL